MNPKQPEMETLKEASERCFKNANPLWNKETLFKVGFKDGSDWQSQHSYSEQEVISMLEALRQRCAESYSKGFTFKSDKECILKVNYSDLLKK